MLDLKINLSMLYMPSVKKNYLEKMEIIFEYFTFNVSYLLNIFTTYQDALELKSTCEQ